jgi:DNA-binding transcriptional LysR family regulator
MLIWRSMNLRHLEVFHAIMQAGSVTGAAHLLNVTQPAVSNVLRHAEQQLQFRLFERIAGRLQPTPEARDLFPDVQEIFGRIETLNRAVHGVRDGRIGRLAIAASPTFVNAYLPKPVARLQRDSPGAQVAIHSLQTAQSIEEKVARREADIGLVYGPVADPGVVVEEVATSTVVVALPRHSPLAKRKVITPKDLRDLVVVATGQTTRIGIAIREAYAAIGESLPAIAVEVTSAQAACLLVAEGMDAGLVDLATALQHPLADVIFRPFSPSIELSLCIIYPKDRPRSRMSIRFTEAVRANLMESIQPQAVGLRGRSKKLKPV